MILADDETASQRSQQSSQRRRPNPPPSPMDNKKNQSPPPPPGPHTPLSHPSLPPYYHSTQSLYSHYSASCPPARRAPSTAGRFCKAFAFAILLWLALGTVTRGVVKLANHSRYSIRSQFATQSRPAGPKPGDGEPEHCLDGFDWVRDKQNPPVEVSPGYFELESSFSLPVDAKALYLLSRGRWSYGGLKVQASDDVDDVLVKVTAAYNDQELIDSAKVCLLSRGDEESGLGVFTPESHSDSNRRRLTWKLDVLIPTGAVLPNFSTHLPIWPHELGDLDGSVVFRKLNLHTSNSPIKAKSVYADEALIHTTNSPVGGRFNVSNGLEIHTSNSPIAIEAQLNNDPARSTATFAKLETSNGIIELEASLVSTAKSGAGGQFDISAQSSNSPLKARLVTAPADSTINLDAHTSNSPARVVLHDAYEGSFKAHTSLMGVTFERLEDPEDPHGEGRERSYSVSRPDRPGNTLEGKVWWGEEGNRKAKLGKVEVTTSILPVTLVV